jgi:small subunit ribosomal protein S20
MANIASQTKRILTNLKATQHNTTFKASMRTAIKRVKALLVKKDVDGAKLALNRAIQLIDKSVSHGVQTKATAARQKSRLMKSFALQLKTLSTSV